MNPLWVERKPRLRGCPTRCRPILPRTGVVLPPGLSPARVRADQRGEWVALPPEPLGAGVQELTLAARVENQPAVASEEVVVVAVPESPPPQPARDVTAEPPSPQPAQDDE